MMNLEEALEELSMQMTEMRCMLENIMQATSEDPISPEIIQVTPRSRPGSGTGYIPEESPPTPVGIMRPSGTTPFPLDTAMSLPGSSLRQLRYEDNLQSTAQVDDFAESISLLAQRAHPNYEISGSEEDPITSCIVHRFCSGQCDQELSSYLSLYPSRVLSELIGACVR